MSDPLTSKPGPMIGDSVEEVQGIFPSDATMQDAIAQLTMAGFDRADLSLPETNPARRHATPEQGASDPVTDTDVRQVRTMGASMAGTIGAMVAAGATIATGGAAGAAIAAAAAVGAGSGLAANAVGNAADAVQSDERDSAARAGHLILAVRAPDTAKRTTAEQIMRSAGADEVRSIKRTGQVVAGIDSKNWTG
jgi:hypothetical protein